MNGFNNSFKQRTQTQTVRRKPRVSNKNVALWIALGLLYFFFMPVGVLVFISLYYLGKIQVAFKWKQYLMPALALLACSTFLYPTLMYLRVTTFILFILYFCGRFSFRMK